MIQIPTFSQWDPVWGFKKLGSSPWTMANSGCYVTSICMALHNYSIQLNPGELCDELNKVKAFTPEGFLTYDGLERGVPKAFFFERVYTTNDPSSNGLEMQPQTAVDRIVRLIRLGMPTVLSVDNLHADGIPDHAVIAYDVKDDGLDFKIKDPDGGKDIWFSSKYGDPLKKIYGYIAVMGQAIRFPDEKPLQGESSALQRMINVVDICNRTVKTPQIREIESEALTGISLLVDG